ncbi:MAG TPA: signal peptide peptidase SppA [Streptosporangiaceae bacterium]|nr:signal peptide peptidase SppA [Streptosporangiaceae bacterium]
MPESLLTTQLAKLCQHRTAPLILELDLTEGISETRPTDPVSALVGRSRAPLPDILDGLRRAREDHRVAVLVARLGGKGIGLAAVQELRQAITEFAAAGKSTVAWAESFGEFSASNVQYYLATAFEKIWLQPSGDLGLTGLAIERVFLRGLLDKFGADFEVAKRHEYKSAAEQFTESGFSAPAREETERLTTSITEQLVQAIAERRGLSQAKVSELINAGPFLAARAQAENLVDQLGYRDEVYAEARKLAGPEAALLYLGRYQRGKILAEHARRAITKNPVTPEPGVALIYATGPIRRGRSGRGLRSGGWMGSDTIAAAIRSAARDEQTKSIVLRVNSPGGSYVASDTIWREVVRARAGGLPVVVSMGDVAASGGYYISMAADQIVAQPGTITGSIGVLTGKPVLGNALGRAGVTSDLISQGAHAAMFSQLRPFSPDEWALVNDWLDHIYADFTGKVADGRNMTPEQVDQVARGRVWTGADAITRGLVDELGGVDRATAAARRRAGLPATAPVRVYPRAHPLDRLRPPSSSESHGAAAASLDLVADSWGPVWQLATRLGLSAAGPLMLPGDWIFE